MSSACIEDIFDHQVGFKDSTAGQILKQIMLHDPIRAALFRKADASLDNWAEQVRGTGAPRSTVDMSWA
jgi:hypothetical protein